MSIKDEVKKKGLQLMGDPRVAKLMQNEQVMRAMMTIVQVPGKVNTFTTEQTERFAKTMRVATAQEVKDLKRTVKNLEAEVSRLRKQIDERR
jgi:RPA family protein